MIKKLVIAMGGFALIALVIIGLYVLYLQIQYHRIEDNKQLEIADHSDQKLQYDTPYSIMSYNIGFGAYGHDFSFFMDKSTLKDTKELIKGKYGKGISKENVLTNSQKSVQIAQENNCDFYILQEVDVNSTRSYEINQSQLFSEGFSNYDSVFASNFHSGFLALPLHDMHGIVNSGILTLSRYNIENSTRRSFPVSKSFISKFFDLDRCFVVNRLNLEDGKKLVLINIHMSAYDEGGIIRKEQLKMLNQVLEDEYKKGNYVIAGGDFNHDYCDSRALFPGNKEIPEWIAIISDSDLAQGYSFVIPNNRTECGTCRGSETPYDKVNTSQFTVDGFIISDNISAEANIVNADYIASDHNPIIMKFTLKKE